MQDVRYESGKSFGSPDNEWTDIKDHMDLPFPSLPYLVDGELRLTQSNAILRYIAKRHQLCGKDPTEEAMADMVSEIANEYRTTLTRLFYNPAFESEGTPPPFNAGSHHEMNASGSFPRIGTREVAHFQRYSG